MERDDVIRATRIAIAHARAEGRDSVTPDDLLAGALQAFGRFGVVALGPIVIDLTAFVIDGQEAGSPEKVAYSEEAAEIFDRAAAIAREDGTASVTCVHLLAAYSNRDSGLMDRLKGQYGFDSAGWRAALAHWANDAQKSNGRDARDVQPLLSPDDAASLLGIHTQTLRGYIKNGKLPAYRLAGERAIRIRRDDLMSLLVPLSPEEAS